MHLLLYRIAAAGAHCVVKTTVHCAPACYEFLHSSLFFNFKHINLSSAKVVNEKEKQTRKPLTYFSYLLMVIFVKLNLKKTV